MLQEQTINGDTCLTYAMRADDQMQNFHVGMLATNPKLRAVPFHCTYVEGTQYLIYKTHTLVPIKVVLQRGQGSNLVKIIKALGETIQELMHYQLMPENLILNENSIFMDSNSETIYLIYLPLTVGTFEVKTELSGLLVMWMETYLKTSQQMTHPLFIQLLLKLRQPQIVFRTLVELMSNDVWSHECESSQPQPILTPVDQEILSDSKDRELHRSEDGIGGVRNRNTFKIRKQPRLGVQIEKFMKSDLVLYAIPCVGVIIVLGVFLVTKVALNTKLGLGMIVLAVSLLGYQKVKTIRKDIPAKFKTTNEKAKVESVKLIKENLKHSEPITQMNQMNQKEEVSSMRQAIQPINHYSEETVMLRSHTPTAVLMLRGDGDSKFYSVIKEITTIGRNPSVCDLVIEETGVGRIHAEVHNTDQKFYIKDLQSLNGTLVNGRRITSNQYFELKSGDQIKIGQSEVIFT